MSHYDDVAAQYDATRGGETRGDELAGLIDAHLPRPTGPVLDAGTGTGVVALGLRRRGWPVVGVDLSLAMLRLAARRLGPAVAQADIRCLPLASRSVAHAVSVWVVHHVEGPNRFFDEVRRVLRPSGRFIVLPNYRDAPGDPVGPVILALHRRAWVVGGGRASVPMDAKAILAVAADAGFSGTVDPVKTSPRFTTAELEMAAIRNRAYAVLAGLDERTFEEVAGPALTALAELGGGTILRPAVTDVVVLQPN